MRGAYTLRYPLTRIDPVRLVFVQGADEHASAEPGPWHLASPPTMECPKLYHTVCRHEVYLRGVKARVTSCA